ncbi:MAG: hypothetical protein AAFN43_11450 [Pseudomonadota bacterium]
MKPVNEWNIPEDGTLVKWAFYCMLSACAIVLALDARALSMADPVVERVFDNPIPPALKKSAPNHTENPDERKSEPYAPFVESSPDAMRKPLAIKLLENNRLLVSGMIDVGAAARFATETETIADYVRIVELNSPGGSVSDALAISTLVREKGWNTHVNKGALCASSCPIVFAGGTVRTAAEEAAIGVHQIYSAGGDTRSVDQAISGTQASTAEIVRHLEEMGADPDLWIHALETPPANLYYFRPDELVEYRLVTPAEGEQALPAS